MQLNLVIYIVLVKRAYLFMRSKPYSSHRMANILEELTWRQNFGTFLVVLLSQILLGWVQPTSCSTRMVSWATELFPANMRYC